MQNYWSEKKLPVKCRVEIQLHPVDYEDGSIIDEKWANFGY